MAKYRRYRCEGVSTPQTGQKIKVVFFAFLPSHGVPGGAQTPFSSKSQIRKFSLLGPLSSARQPWTSSDSSQLARSQTLAGPASPLQPRCHCSHARSLALADPRLACITTTAPLLGLSCSLAHSLSRASSGGQPASLPPVSELARSLADPRLACITTACPPGQSLLSCSLEPSSEQWRPHS